MRAVAVSTRAAVEPQMGELRAVFLLGSITALTPAAVDAYVPALPSLARDLRASPSSAQLTLTTLLAGLALGQLVVGPISDGIGRRRPVLIGLAGFILASLLCAVAPSIWLLLPLRFVQGASGAAAVVVARAVVRDMYSGHAAARMFASLMLVLGAAPIAAPVIGAQLLRFTSWRGVFFGLAAAGLCLWGATYQGLPETLPMDLRRPANRITAVRTLRELMGDRAYLRYGLASGLGYAAMFAYISGSSFFLERHYNLSAQEYSGVFAMNAFGLIAFSQLSRLLVRRLGPSRLLTSGVTLSAIGGIALLCAIAGGFSLAAVLPALFAVVAAVGLIAPNATALALAGYGHMAGSASAPLGLLQYILGAAVAPLAGLHAGPGAMVMGVVIAICGTSSLLLVVVGRPGRNRESFDS